MNLQFQINNKTDTKLLMRRTMTSEHILIFFVQKVSENAFHHKPLETYKEIESIISLWYSFILSTHGKIKIKMKIKKRV